MTNRSSDTKFIHHPIHYPQIAKQMEHLSTYEEANSNIAFTDEYIISFIAEHSNNRLMHALEMQTSFGS